MFASNKNELVNRLSMLISSSLSVGGMIDVLVCGMAYKWNPFFVLRYALVLTAIDELTGDCEECTCVGSIVDLRLFAMQSTTVIEKDCINQNKFYLFASNIRLTIGLTTIFLGFSFRCFDNADGYLSDG